MYRFAIVGCSVVLLSSAVAAFATEPTLATERSVREKSVLAKHGLTQFDLDGNGTLDASERAAATAARRAARYERSVSMAASASEYPYFYSPVGNPYVAPRSLYTHLPGGLLISPTSDPQTISGFCRLSGKYQYLTVAPAGVFPHASPVR